MKKILLIFTFLAVYQVSFSQELLSENLSINDFVDGTLLKPKNQPSKTLAIIIAGSGPTNRDGNQTAMKNNSLKQLAYYLADEGIASFRYDKRIFKLAKNQMLDESQLRFDDFVVDAASVVNYFKLYHDDEYNYEKFILIGHSQGALVAKLASLRTAVEALILLNGTAQPIDEIMINQLGKQAPFLVNDLKSAFDSIKKVGYVKAYNPLLKTILRKDVQPFMQSWMQYDPVEVAKKIEKPTLVIGGTTDIQVPADDAKILAESIENAEYAIIENMNHVLKTIESIGLENQKAYNKPNLPLSNELKTELKSFLQKIK